MEEKELLDNEKEPASPVEQEGTPVVPTGETENAQSAPVEAQSALETASEQENVSAPVIEQPPVIDVTHTEIKPKKSHTKLILIICGAVVTCALVAFLVVYFTIIKPNGIYDDAVAALEAGNHMECERLINQIPNHEKVPALRVELDLSIAEYYIEQGELDMAETLLVKHLTNEKAAKLKTDIQYLRAVELVEKGNFDEAKLIMDKLSDHDDPQQLREQIKYAEALAALEEGDYETAFDCFSELGDYKDAEEQKGTVYYEALALKSLFLIQPTLKNPASLRVTKVTFYDHPTTDGELNAIYEITATNSYGGSLGAYAYDITLYDDEDGTGMISKSSYADPSDLVDTLKQIIVDTIKKQEVHETKVDVARMNRLIQGNASFKIDLPFESDATVEI